MLSKAYSRSLLEYKITQVSFPRDVYRRSGTLLKWGTKKPKLSKIGLAVLFTDYRTTSDESMLATHSHLLPIQPSRASSLLPSLLWQNLLTNPPGHAHYINSSNWFFAYKTGRLNFYRFCPFHICMYTHHICIWWSELTLCTPRFHPLLLDHYT